MTPSCCCRPNFEKIASTPRAFLDPDRALIGPVPTIALTPTADGRNGAYEDNAARTWKLTEKVHDLITQNIKLPDGTPVRIVVAPEIVYGARSGARAQAYYATQGVSANIWIARSWCYSDELMSACQGIGSSEWQQAAYGLNQTDRPGAVWLKAFTAAMDEKKRPIFSIYSPDLEDETEPFNAFIGERLLRFARCATAVAMIRGKNYLNIGSVSMGIIGSDARRNIMLDYLGLGTCNFDMAGVRGRLNTGFYDHEEAAKAVAFFKNSFTFDFGSGKRPLPPDELIDECAKTALVVRDLMIGNPRLADPAVGKKQGFTANIEHAQGYNAIAAGTQGQRQWTDYHPNFDMAESILNSSFDWNGFRAPMIVATENDSKNGIGMMIGNLLSGGAAQLFADIRTNWTPASIKKATGIDVSDICPNGIIDKRNSGAAALDYAVDVFKLMSDGAPCSVQEVMDAIRTDKALQQKLITGATTGTHYMGAALTYFPGDGLSSHFRSPGGVPLTSYRYNVVGDLLTCSVIEGDSVDLPQKVADHICRVTDATWPETYWAPRGMTSFEYMDRIGPNHDGSSFGLIGADFITFNAMLRIPVDMHNVAPADVFRPTMWHRFGGDDFRVCDYLGPVYS